MEISSKNKDIKRIVEKNPRLREKLFARGFLFTDQEIDQNGYPFYGKWPDFDRREYNPRI